jgi:hypothetical protein
VTFRCSRFEKRFGRYNSARLRRWQRDWLRAAQQRKRLDAGSQQRLRLSLADTRQWFRRQVRCQRFGRSAFYARRRVIGRGSRLVRGRCRHLDRSGEGTRIRNRFRRRRDRGGRLLDRSLGALFDRSIRRLFDSSLRTLFDNVFDSLLGLLNGSLGTLFYNVFDSVFDSLLGWLLDRSLDALFNSWYSWLLDRSLDTLFNSWYSWLLDRSLDALFKRLFESLIRMLGRSLGRPVFTLRNGTLPGRLVALLARASINALWGSF